ncbi:MAG: FAD-dependent oxidoreductase [Chloroflexi bacterium]|nr:FAD-dependent oxidoreductase [Chloroflexota bacterium]
MNSNHQENADVIVVGGGTSGCVAAIAAARAGADTLLVERYGFLGGTATFGNPFHGFMDGHGELVVRGIPDEIIQRLVAEGGSSGHLRHMSWGPGAPEGIECSFTPYDHELIKYVLIKMCEESGVRLLLHAFLSGVVMEGDRVRGVTVLTKSGQRDLLGKVIVDATGDGDVAAMAGAEFDYGGEEREVQNVTLLFKVGGADIDRAFEALKAGNSQLQGWGNWHNKVKHGPRFGETESSMLGFQARVSSRFGGEKDADQTIILSCSCYRQGVTLLNLTRTTKIDGTRDEDLTRAEIEERKKVVEAVKALREERVPGFENCYLLATAPQVGIRESRRIVGEYVLTKDDVLEGRKFRDGIARGAYPIDIHDPKGGAHFFHFIKDGDSYDIPYRCLVPKSIDGLVIAGRAVSCDHDALGSVRNQATVAAIGQAAGVAAALAAEQRIAPRQLVVEGLGRALVQQGAYLGAEGPEVADPIAVRVSTARS